MTCSLRAVAPSGTKTRPGAEPSPPPAASRSARSSPGRGVARSRPLPSFSPAYFIRKEKKRRGAGGTRERGHAPPPTFRFLLARPPSASRRDAPMERRDTARWAGPERGVGGGSVQQPCRGSASIAETPLLHRRSRAAPRAPSLVLLPHARDAVPARVSPPAFASTFARLLHRLCLIFSPS